MLFNLAARPALEYAFQTFFPNNIKIHQDLERLILSTAASTIGLNYNTKSETKKTLMGIESLECRRDYLRINFWRKISQLDYLTNDLIKEAKIRCPHNLKEWSTLQSKYNIKIPRQCEDPKFEVKKQVQHYLIKKDLKEMQKSNQAQLAACILKKLDTYILLPFWDHPDWKNSRCVLKAISGCDWLTPTKYEQPSSKCFGCGKLATSRHLLIECINDEVIQTRSNTIAKLTKETTDETEIVTINTINTFLPSKNDNLQTISEKKRKSKIFSNE